jgi:SAM-dependent methyltransferase
LDLDTLSWLRSPAGQATLADLAVRAPADSATLHELERLRRTLPPEQARAALELAALRRRARAKFPAADHMYFTREALEQASAAPVAAHRAARLAPRGHIADLCCSIGGDALAIAGAGARVTAVDRDPLRLALARANAEALGLADRIAFVEQDLLAEPPPSADALFCDPGRRAGGRRRFNVEEYEPPLATILGWRAQTPALAAKLAPGVELAQLPADAEVEFVSLDGELKEAALWCRPLAEAARRATLLRTRPGGPAEAHELVSGAASPQVISPPRAFLYEPDPAVIRAGLVTDLAARLGAAQLDPQIAYLTADGLAATPFARAWPILEWLPFGLKPLRARLRALDAGPVTVKKRGSPLDTDALARQLSGRGARELVVVLTQAQAKPVALICGTVVAPDI